jgi:hypothetical protein
MAIRIRPAQNVGDSIERQNIEIYAQEICDFFECRDIMMIGLHARIVDPLFDAMKK